MFQLWTFQRSRDDVFNAHSQDLWEWLCEPRKVPQSRFCAQRALRETLASGVEHQRPQELLLLINRVGSCRILATKPFRKLSCYIITKNGPANMGFHFFFRGRVSILPSELKAAKPERYNPGPPDPSPDIPDRNPKS